MIEYRSWAIVSGQVADHPDDGRSLTDYWTADELGRWYVTFTNPGPGFLWVRAVFRRDIFSDPIAIRPAVRVSPGRTAIFDLEHALDLPRWPVIDPKYAYRHLPEYDIALAYVGGEWQVIQP